MVNSNESEPQRQFFVVGVQTYLDVRDAITEFERQVKERCINVAQKRLAEIANASGTGFWQDLKPTDYEYTTKSGRRIGAKLPDSGAARLRFCLELRRDAVAPRALVFLARKGDVAAELWAKKLAIDEQAGDLQCDDRHLYFGHDLSEEQIVQFDKYLNDSISQFIKFVQQAGPLTNYFSE